MGKVLTGAIGTIDSHFGMHIKSGQYNTRRSGTSKWTRVTGLNFGAKAVAMEVSSHALALDRVDSLEFDVAVLTNLTREHLEFHGTLEKYIQAKGRLFHELLTHSKKAKKRAILNAEDPVFEKFIPSSVPTWTYGVSKGDLTTTQVENVSRSNKI